MDETQKKIQDLEASMANPSFWEDKARAQEKLKELQELKARAARQKNLEKGNAVITIFSGAGGTDAEDWARMLFDMYVKFAEKRGYSTYLLHKNENDHGGIRNITFEVRGENAYGLLKNESGVHRLVRVSPFSARKLRHTSFAMVEVVPEFRDVDGTISPQEVRIEFSKAGGPGGQNVNKRQTAVRVVHVPTGLTAHCESERSQAQNKERALAILAGKLYRLRKEAQLKEAEAYHVSKTTEAEWGNQIRSYILHPYKLVKDHRSHAEHKDPYAVLEEGDLDIFIQK